MGDIPQFHLFIRKLWQPIVFFPNLTPKRPQGNLWITVSEAWERFPTFAWSAECWFPGWEVAWFEGSGGLCHGKIYLLMVSFFSTMLRLWYITTPQRLTMYLLGMFWSHQPVELSWRESHTSRKHLVDLSWTEIHILKMLVYFTKVWEVVKMTPARRKAEKRAESTRSAWMGQWNRRPRRKLQYSPLVENFLRARKYSSVNLVRATRHLGLSVDTAPI